jgi:acetolactate synthase-1/2/3 large subunit
MEARTGADLLVDNLYAHGVRTIFGMPGSHTTALYEAIDRHGHIQTILIRNEQAGAYAADGYARVTGRPGVICTTAGPGATNALSGIAEAWADSVPLLLLAGQVNHNRIHQECGSYHEIDLEGIFRPCTRYVTTVMEHAQIPRAVAEAFRALTQGRRRPAALMLPRDLMGQPLHRLPPTVWEQPVAAGRTDTDAIGRAAEVLARARRPLLLAGGGALWSGSGEELRRLAARLDCPVATTLNGKGILDERDPRALGHLRSPRGREALPEADLVIAFGCRFTEVFTGFRSLRVPPLLIQVDLDPVQIGMNYPVTIGIVADAAEVLRLLLDALPPRCQSDWSAIWPAVRAARSPQPEWLIETLRATVPEDAIVFTDASEMAYRMHMEYPAYAPRTFFYPSNYIALGWGFPAAVGAAVAMPGRAIISMSGDGGFVMTCQELATAARYRLRVIAVVHNDQTYGAIKHLQRLKHEGRYRDTDLNNPDFVKLAEAYDVPASRARNADELARALRTALDRGGPALIEVPDQWRYLRV